MNQQVNDNAVNLDAGGLYSIHFSDKISHSQHYLGFAESNIGQRIERHKRGQGARLTRVAAEMGIEMTVARTWEGADRNFERHLKRRKYGPKLCPICNPERARQFGKMPDKNFGVQVH